MLLPTAIAILGTLANIYDRKTDEIIEIDPTRLRVGIALMLMLAYGASVGGLLTPVGSPPNLIGRGLIEEATGEKISFLEWLIAALPICGLMFLALCAILLTLNKPEVKRLEGVEEYVAEERSKLGPLSRKEKNTLIAFGVAVTLWIAPGFVALIAGDESKTYEEVTNRLDEGVVAVLAASLLFLLPTNWPKREFTLTWNEAKDIDWGTILLFGTGIIFGSLLADSGLAETIGTWGSDTLGVNSEVSITIFAVILAIVISETTSNTASAAVVVPIIIPVAVAAGVDPMVPALAATFAASFGFMLPVSTPQNAIVYGSGVVPITQMVRNGFFFDVVGALLIVVGIPILVGALGI
jgi:sodium-dependent dicarboxylate transporter 2/3/5